MIWVARAVTNEQECGAGVVLLSLLHRFL